MIESLLHFLGFCPDHFTHINLIDLIVLGLLTPILTKSKSIYYKIKSIIKKQP